MLLPHHLGHLRLVGAVFRHKIDRRRIRNEHRGEQYPSQSHSVPLTDGFLQVAILTTSMFLCGYILGPILWAPISEIVGRRPVFIGTLFCFALCEIGERLASPARRLLPDVRAVADLFLFTVLLSAPLFAGDALGKNIETIVIMRLLAGTFAASPLTNCGGVIAGESGLSAAEEGDAEADLLAVHRHLGRCRSRQGYVGLLRLRVHRTCDWVGLPSPCSRERPLNSPFGRPIIGGFVSMSYLTWRWIFWVMGIWALLCTVLVVLFLPETYHPKRESPFASLRSTESERAPADSEYHSFCSTRHTRQEATQGEPRDEQGPLRRPRARRLFV